MLLAYPARTRAIQLVMFLLVWLLAAPAGAQSLRPGAAARDQDDASRTAAARLLTGMVRTEADDPLPGATLMLKGTFTGSSTNADGEFKLSLPADANPASATISVAYPGFETLEIPLSAISGGPLDLVLSPVLLPTTVVWAAPRGQDAAARAAAPEAEHAAGNGGLLASGRAPRAPAGK